MPMEEMLRFAAAAAALKCTKAGGRAGIPNRATLDAFLARHGNRNGHPPASGSGGSGR
jgi:sugar/nucleoside kinase (ribokinase family)